MSLFLYSSREIPKLEKQKQIFEGDFYFLPFRQNICINISDRNFRVSCSHGISKFIDSLQWIIEMCKCRFGIRKHPEFFKNRAFFSRFWHSSPIVPGDISRIPSTLFMVVYFGTLLCSFSHNKMDVFWENIRLGFVYWDAIYIFVFFFQLSCVAEIFRETRSVRYKL